jgi:PBP1b-binding outer membrane lipoprotein LpoB
MNLKSKIYLCVLFGFLLFTNCQGQNNTENKVANNTTTSTDYEKLKNYLLTISDSLYLENYDAIIFLSEKGGCPTCYKVFSDFTQQSLLNQDNILILVNAKGEKIDISPYLSDAVSNVVTDYTNNFYRLNLIRGSGIILLKDNTISEVHSININEINKQLGIIRNLERIK